MVKSRYPAPVALLFCLQVAHEIPFGIEDRIVTPWILQISSDKRDNTP